MEAKTAPLWAIGDELAEIGALIAEAEGELTEDIEARLDALEGSFFAKVERIALMMREREGDAEKAKAEEARLAAIRKYHEKTAKGLKDYLEGCMARAGIDRVETVRARVRRYRNPQPAVHYGGDIATLPDELVTIVPEHRTLNRAEVLRAHKEGGPLPEGVRVEYGHHVRVL